MALIQCGDMQGVIHINSIMHVPTSRKFLLLISLDYRTSYLVFNLVATIFAEF